MYVRGAIGCRNIELHSLWSNKWGTEFFKNAMSRDRFLEILRYLRFDIRATRRARLETDKFALISEVWYDFIQNCQNCYIPGPYVTADEQLFPSKCRCRFTQFMAQKPDKYGQKFWMLVDRTSKYMLNAFPYLGKDEERPDNDRLADFVIMKLMDPYLNKGRNITCDNYFTSKILAEQLGGKKTSIIGTVDKKRREIPADVKKAKETLYDTCALKNGNMTLTVYQGKRKENVVILSTMHPDIQVGAGEKKKPETIECYNKTKYGVDVVDQMARKYSVKAPSRRWPVHIFYNILDLCGINAWILYKQCTNVKISRRNYLLKLSEELASMNMNQRGRLLEPDDEQDQNQEAVPATSATRKRCQVRQGCGKGAKSVYTCTKCKKHVCKKCTKTTTYV